MEKGNFLLKLTVGISVLSILIVTGGAMAGTTGKISGTVIDADTKELIPGVSIVIVGTNLGATTDIDGRYFVINITPGEYALQAIMIGYQTVTKTGVRVIIDRTAEMNFELKETIIEVGKEIVVQAERALVPMDVSASQSVMDAQSARSIPVDDFQQVISTLPGVSGSSIRGGGRDQTLLLLDSFPLVDELYNLPYMGLNMTAIKEIEVLTGGFNAEYGNVRSGIINVVTKEGEDKLSMALDYRYIPPRRKHNGPNAFGKDQYDWIVYGSDRSMEPVVNTNGDSLFMGWTRYADLLLSNDDSKDDKTPMQCRELWRWVHRPIRYADRPDQFFDGSIGGPFPGRNLPLAGDLLRKIRWFLSHRFTYQMFAMPLYRDHYWESNSEAKVTILVRPEAKLTLTGLYGEQKGLGAQYIDVGSFGLGTDNGTKDYYGAMYSLRNVYTGMIGVKLVYTPSQRTVWEFWVSGMHRNSWMGKAPVRDTTGVHEIPADIYKGRTYPAFKVDETPKGWWGPGTEYDQVGIYRLSGGADHVDNSWSSNYSFGFDMSAQIGRSNLLKAGFEFVYNEFHKRLIINQNTLEQPYNFNEFPKRSSLYIQDKLEFQGMIANLGLRLDYTDPSALVYSPGDPFSSIFSYGVLDSLKYAPARSAKWRVTLAPRIGVSHPMTENSKIYFNYGHFYQVPQTEARYGFFLHPNKQGRVDRMGNPDLRSPRTIAYELGTEYNLFDMFQLHVASYYKEMSNQLGPVRYTNRDNSTTYGTFANNNYGSAAGAEFRLMKPYGTYLTGWIQTEMAGGNAGMVGFENLFQPDDPIRTSNFYNPTQISGRQWKWTPSFLASVTLQTPVGFGPKILGIRPLGSWRINLIQSYSRGGTFTWNPQNKPDLKDNMRYQDSYNTDMKVEKEFVFGDWHPSLYLDVRNLFNRKSLNLGALGGDYQHGGLFDYLASLQPGDRVGDYDKPYLRIPWKQQEGYLTPYDYMGKLSGRRTVYMGLRVNLR